MKWENLPDEVTASMYESLTNIDVDKELLKQIHDLKPGDKFMIKSSDQKGEALNVPLTFVKYNKWWTWIVCKNEDGVELKAPINKASGTNPFEIEKLK